MKKPMIFLCMAAVWMTAAAQQTVLTEALMLPLDRGLTRGVLTIDPVEALVISGRFTAPEAGGRIMHADSVAGVWEQATADSNGWFEQKAQQGGYAYMAYDAPHDTTVMLWAMGAFRYWVNSEPHAGLKYAIKDEYESWEPRFDYGAVPVRLKKGVNHLLFHTNRYRFKALMEPAEQPVFLSLKDNTLPDIVAGEKEKVWGAVLLVNAGDEWLKDVVLTTGGDGWVSCETPVGPVAPYSVRKVKFAMQPGQAADAACAAPLLLKLLKGSVLLNEATLEVQVKNPDENHKRTFVSGIDGSVQYYSVNPCRGDGPNGKPALLLSVHGAGVEAVNQAGSYAGKSWVNIIAATNRRPFGYDWEDWGRTDALEVLADAKRRYPFDEERIYLTGHSMGGHGTWHLGVTFPDLWGAIAPSAGWISFDHYAPRQSGHELSTLEILFDRARTPGKTLLLKENYKDLGIYVLHGQADQVVKVDQARTMVAEIDSFHNDWELCEVPGQGHWWDLSDEEGADVVDWAPLFDFLGRHSRPMKARVRQVAFKTANPGVSPTYQWLTIEQQIKSLKISGADICVHPYKRRFVGSTENVRRMSLDASVLMPGEAVTLWLDGDTLTVTPETQTIHLIRLQDRWQTADVLPPSEKGPHRYGPLKEAFNHHVMLVYGTHGSNEENAWALNKVRFDAERWWTQGNGSLDIVSDEEFVRGGFKGRSVILYGNRRSNAAWKSLLKDAPILVDKGRVRVGQKEIKGKGLGCFVCYPRMDESAGLVGVVGGTDLQGMRLTDNRPYLYAGYALPDVTVFDISGLKAAGFFGHDWQSASGEFEGLK